MFILNIGIAILDDFVNAIVYHILLINIIVYEL